jgi:hypothetical protein
MGEEGENQPRGLQALHLTCHPPPWLKWTVRSCGCTLTLDVPRITFYLT